MADIVRRSWRNFIKYLGSLIIMPTYIRMRIAWTAFRLTYCIRGWSLNRALVGARFVFYLHECQLEYIYKSSALPWPEESQRRILDGLLSDGLLSCGILTTAESPSVVNGGVNGGRVSVALLFISCMHMRGYLQRPELMLDQLDYACLTARGKRASELIL
jgi:hypothetical protein